MSFDRLLGFLLRGSLLLSLSSSICGRHAPKLFLIPPLSFCRALQARLLSVHPIWVQQLASQPNYLQPTFSTSTASSSLTHFPRPLPPSPPPQNDLPNEKSSQIQILMPQPPTCFLSLIKPLNPIPIIRSMEPFPLHLRETSLPQRWRGQDTAPHQLRAKPGGRVADKAFVRKHARYYLSSNRVCRSVSWCAVIAR